MDIAVRVMASTEVGVMAVTETTTVGVWWLGCRDSNGGIDNGGDCSVVGGSDGNDGGSAGNNGVRWVVAIVGGGQ